MNLFNDKQTFKLVVKAIQTSQSDVSYNKTWKHLNRELGIGLVFGEKLRLTTSDRQHLAQLIAKETEIDATTFDLSLLSDLTRIEISNQVIDEKWSNKKIRESIIYLRSLNDELRLDRNYAVPTGGYLAIPWQQAINHKHNIIIAIENLEVFLNAQSVNWPQELLFYDPVIVYRGDTEAAPSAFKQFIEATTQCYYVFFDYDPAGFVMALTQPRQPLLIIPDASVEILKKYSKKSAYNNQFKSVEYLKNKTSVFQSHIDAITIHQLAVMQEKIISSQMSLKVISV